MDSAAALTSLHCSVGIVSPLCSSAERPSVVSMHNGTWLTSTKSRIQGPTLGWELVSPPIRRAGVVSCVKTSDASIIDKANGSLEKNTSGGSTFPNGFEELVMGVCDETQIAELKMKIGDFEMHLKRNIKSAEAPVPIASPTEPPPIPTKPMSESISAVSPPPPKSSSEKSNPFANETVKKSRKLASLEASGASGYVLVSSPTVGSFRKGRTFKGKKQPPVCKEGDIIKEGQTICYVDQFGTELPVKSDAAGEVIKILFDEGEAVGYGDPLLAVLPSFHDINV